MKKRISLLVSTLALVALASFAQAAPGTKFAVQGPDGAVTPVDNFTVSDTGQVYAKAIGVNTAAPGGPLEVVKEWPNSAGTNIHSVFTSYGDSTRFTARRANGTLAAPTATLNGNQIGNLNFRGHNGTAWTGATSALVVNAEGDFTPTSLPTNMVFFTSAVNTTVGTEKLRITADGRFRVSNQPAAPATATTACTKGDLIFDATNSFLYFCTATNTWKRTAFSTF